MSIYLQIPNLSGEGISRSYPNQFGLNTLSWSGMVAQSSNVSGMTNFTSLKVSKLASIHSPTLMLYMASQQNLGTVVITQTKIGNTKEIPVNVYTLDNALLTGFSQTVDTSVVPLEEMVFIFSRATLTQFAYNIYDEQTARDTHSWDVRNNVGS